MTYEETIEYLYNSAPLFQNVGKDAYKEGVDNSLALDRHLEFPHKAYSVIHVAGTNGKGSCSHTIAAILQKAGYKVGLYTSPHLVDFRERIRVNGQMAEKNFVIDFVEKHRKFFEPLHPSFFELTTAMAFEYFKEMAVDYAVVEVGLGGRLDCTNIVTPLLSIITNISFDHTQFLGNTLAMIAREKAGIIKPTVRAVIGETLPETKAVFVSVANDKHAPLVLSEDVPQVLKASHENGYIVYTTRDFGVIKGELEGDYQVKNANTVLNAIVQLRQLGVDIPLKSVVDGFANVCEATGLQGRWQRIGQNPLIVCDTGHNLGGWQYLVKQIERVPCRQLRVVFGMVGDKDISSVVSILPSKAVYYFAKATVKRAEDPRRIYDMAANRGLKGKAYPTVPEAFEAAKTEASPEDFIYVGGSSFVVADFLKYLSSKTIKE